MPHSSNTAKAEKQKIDYFSPLQIKNSDSYLHL